MFRHDQKAAEHAAAKMLHREAWIGLHKLEDNGQIIDFFDAIDDNIVCTLLIAFIDGVWLQCAPHLGRLIGRELFFAQHHAYGVENIVCIKRSHRLTILHLRAASTSTHPSYRWA